MRVIHTYECLDINPERRVKEVVRQTQAELTRLQMDMNVSVFTVREFNSAVKARLRDRAILAYASACILVSRSEKRGPHTVSKAELIEEIGAANIDAIEAALSIGWLVEGREGYLVSRPSKMDFASRIQ